jgi:hypothetical protein
MDALDYTILALAAWRLASLLVNEDGPFDAFRLFRMWVGVEPIVLKDADGNLQAGTATKNSFAKGLTCLWCVSVWTALALVVAEIALMRWGVPRTVLRAIVATLAISALAILFHEVVERVRR